MRGKRNGLSIIIPVYNEEKLIVKNTERLLEVLGKGFGLKASRKFRVPYEVIICDNGSTDSTVKKGEVLAEKYKGRVRFIHSYKRGVGAAFKRAVVSASFDRIISLDMDLTTHLNFIYRCFAALDSNSIVVGSKIVGVQNRPIIRRFLSGAYIVMTKILLGLNYSDYSIGAKGYRKSNITRELKKLSDGSFYVTELLYFAKQKGRHIVELPVYCRDTRKSKFSLWREVSHRFNSLLTFWFRMKIAKNIPPTTRITPA